MRAEAGAGRALGFGQTDQVGGAMRLAEGGGVEFGLVAEMIVDGGEVDPGALGDLAGGGRTEAALREDLARRVQEALAKFADGQAVLGARHENSGEELAYIKQSFKSVN